MKKHLLLALLLSGCPTCATTTPLVDTLCDSDGGYKPGCDCVNGQVSFCGSSVGTCVPGQVTCTGGKWPRCVPQVIPTEEKCDPEGLDTDCDGDPDNAPPISCWDGPDGGALWGSSVCRAGVTQCVNHQTTCVGQVLPQVERCGIVDFNCDGIPGNPSRDDLGGCGPQEEVGACTRGETTCTLSGEHLCVGAVYPQAEECDGVDNNCDGDVDEDLYRPCHTDCGSGIEHCSDGVWVGCTAQQPIPDVVCDGYDSTCQGHPDQGLTCDCVFGNVRQCIQDVRDMHTGEVVNCGIGIQECSSNGSWGLCYFYRTSAEICNNWDDDCDGNIDGMRGPCNAPESSQGECRAGVSQCLHGSWGSCEGSVPPQQEICDGLDNDCDGDIDNGLRKHTAVDMLFLVDVSPSMCAFIAYMEAAISAYAGGFTGTPHRFALAVFPGTDPDGFSHPGLPNTFYTRVIDFTDVQSFQTALATLGCAGGGEEPSIDTMFYLSQPSSDLSWSPTHYPYIFMISDEYAQTWEHRTVQEVANNTRNCALGSCVLGDAIEVFILTGHLLFEQWLPVVGGDYTHLFGLYPISTQRYVEIFNNVFREVCR